MSRVEVLSSFEKAVRARDMGRVLSGAACLIWGGEPDWPELLLIQRTGAHGADTWAPPGGWVDAGEDPAETVVREVWEEVSLELRTVEFRGYTFDRHPEGIEGVTLWFSCKDWAGTPRRAYGARVKEAEWFRADVLPMPLFPAFRNAIEKGLLG